MDLDRRWCNVIARLRIDGERQVGKQQSVIVTEGPVEKKPRGMGDKNEGRVKKTKGQFEKTRGCRWVKLQAWVEKIPEGQVKKKRRTGQENQRFFPQEKTWSMGQEKPKDGSRKTWGYKSRKLLARVEKNPRDGSRVPGRRIEKTPRMGRKKRGYHVKIASTGTLKGKKKGVRRLTQGVLVKKGKVR